MSERERWVVYPLLFLALGAALRDKLVDRTTAKSIVCQELLVVEEQPLGREAVVLARIGRADKSNNDEPPFGSLLLNGQLEVVDRAANPLVTIGRARFGTDGRTGGHVHVRGQVSVEGAVFAALYAYLGQPIAPVVHGMFPGASVPAEVMRSQASQQAAERSKAASPAKSSNEDAPADSTPSPPSDAAGQSTTSSDDPRPSGQ